MSAALGLQYLVAGITVGSVYAIVGIGFNVIYNATGIINFAQGEFLMLGGMIAITLQPLLPLPVAVLAAALIAGAVGILLYYAFFSWLENPAALRMIIITIALSILVREAALHVWDEKVHALPFWTGDETSSVAFLGARFSPQVIWVLAVSAALVIGLTLFFRLTLMGRAMRACSASRTATRLCGIRPGTVIAFSFFLAASMGALAGAAISPLTQTQYDMGSTLAVKGFTCAVLGGLGNSVAAAGAGLLLGVLESFSVAVLPLAYKDVVSLAILLVVLFVRPEGLFAPRTPTLTGRRA